jgi:gamma-glutamyl-gamma-aminobutyrate hydrolase PuuD
MQHILITQRLEKWHEFNEFRDCLDCRFIRMIKFFGFNPIVIPNHIIILKNYLKNLNIKGFIMSGGGDIFKRDERYEIELVILKEAIKKKLPLLGVCRGAQRINNFFGGKQKKIPNHVATNHKINFYNSKYKSYYVNSFHEYGFSNKEFSKHLDILATSNDNFIEFFKHKKHKIWGMMWHPERYENLREFEKKIFKSIFNK